jgi:hypothetical protein
MNCRARYAALAALAFSVAAANAPADEPVWWSFRPVARPAVPRPRGVPAQWVRTPVDAFVLAKLREKGLEPAPEADRRTLIRRLAFDLTGLPPTPAEIAAWLADTSPDAYERLVDRLLASPHYGERWARHWMDVAHFAETHGHDQDRVRANAWPYRDYLVAAFNADTPYARFVGEQLAADVLHPDEPRLTPALGFLAAGPWDESSLRDIREDSLDRQVGYYLDRDDVVTTVMSTFASLTVQCARCHDHKFDPIPTEDYYGLQAVFAGVGRADRAYDTDPATRQRRRHVRATLAVQLAGQGARWPAVVTAAGAELALPPQRLVYAAARDFAPDGSHRPTPSPRPVHVLKRGDIRRPGPAAPPGAVSCLPGVPGRFDVTSVEGERRAALARWLTRPDNPLTWRSVVNRVWHYHFGRGLVETPNDFGRMGSKPTHPELLDWLACEFRDGGGSLKTLHRLIVTSAAYRQSSRHDGRAAAADADNRLLWRMPRSRLDAEQFRDAVLLASGRLDRRMGGPSDRQFAMKPGLHVTPIVEYGPFAWDRAAGHRRSVYRFVFRTLPDPFVDCLDGADASQLTAVRNVSVTAPQALALWNNDFVLVHSRALAKLLEASEADPGRRIAIACERAWGRPPTTDEAAEMRAYADRHGLASLCRLLFNANEFCFVE